MIDILTQRIKIEDQNAYHVSYAYVGMGSEKIETHIGQIIQDGNIRYRVTKVYADKSTGEATRIDEDVSK